MGRFVTREEQNESISFVKLFSIFNKKNIINTLLITLLFTLIGFTYLFFTTPTYKSHVSLEIDGGGAEGNRAGGDDLINMMNMTTISDIETEMDVVKSDLLISRVISRVSDSVSYYDVSGLKDIELYSKTPILLSDIKVFNKSIFNQKICIHMVDSEHFKIYKYKTSFKRVLNSINFLTNKSDLERGVYKFGDIVKGKGYSFVVHNIGADIDKSYAVSIRRLSEQMRNIRQKLNVQPASARSSVIKITYEDNNPYRVHDVLQFLSQAYIKLNIDKKSETASSTLDFIDTQIKTVKKQLKYSADKLKAYKETNNFIDIDIKSRQISDQMVEYEKQYSEAKLQYQSFKILYDSLKKGNYDAVGGFSREFPILERLIVELQTASAEKASILTNLTEGHPEVLALSAQMKNSSEAIARVSKGILNNLQERVIKLKALLTQEDQVMDTLPKKEQEVLNLERVYKVNENLFSYLLERQSELSLLGAAHVSNIRMLDRPKVVLTPSKPNKQIVLMTSIFLGLITAFLISLLNFNNTIRTVDELMESTDIPLFGIIPYVDKEYYNKAYVLEDNTSTASEAFRAMRTNLDYIVSSGKSKVIMISSSVPNEGKTVVAANLASVMGMSEKKVIILSLDLRRPEMHHKFGLTNKVGMSDILSNRVGIDEAIWQHEIYANLNIITSGRIPPNPAELLASGRMKEVLDVLKASYDCIILDTPPINYVSDAMVLFKYADINLFVVKSGFSDKIHLNELNKMVKKLNIKHAGIVLNSVKSKFNKTEQFDSKYIYYEAL